MKVILVNGSPNENGCTRRALSEIENVLGECGVEAEVFNIGCDAIAGCLGCRACRDLGHCVIDDKVNEFLDSLYDWIDLNGFDETGENYNDLGREAQKIYDYVYANC